MDGELEDGVVSKLKIRFEDILSFATGATSEPPIGFYTPPTLRFHDEIYFPKANTCANVLSLSFLPMSYKKFVYYVSYGILNTAGFGRV